MFELIPQQSVLVEPVSVRAVFNKRPIQPCDRLKYEPNVSALVCRMAAKSATDTRISMSKTAYMEYQQTSQTSIRRMTLLAIDRIRHA
jgi:hypothetical protein